MTGFTPVLHGSTEVHEGSFLHTTRDLCDERIVFSLGYVERLVDVLPGRPGHPVRAEEAMGCQAEVVDETRDPDSAAAIPFLSGGEAHRHGVSGRHPALRTG